MDWCDETLQCLRCIMELNQPFFGHEFVYRSIILGMDGDESQIQVIEALLKEAVLRRVCSHTTAHLIGIALLPADSGIAPCV